MFASGNADWSVIVLLPWQPQSASDVLTSKLLLVSQPRGQGQGQSIAQGKVAVEMVTTVTSTVHCCLCHAGGWLVVCCHGDGCGWYLCLWREASMKGHSTHALYITCMW